MPTSKIKKDAREGKGSVKHLEHEWDEAKKDAGAKGGKQNWPLTMHIYEKRTHQATAESKPEVAHFGPPKRKLKRGSPFTRLNAAMRLTVMSAMEVNCDAFEGWINTLGYHYQRTEGREEAVVEAPLRQLVTDLKDNGWTKVKEPPTHPYTFRKGKHTVALEPEGDRTTITNMD